MNREVREFIKEARDEGWWIDRKHKHIKLLHPSGAAVWIAKTPSDFRWKENTLCKMRKAIAARSATPASA